MMRERLVVSVFLALLLHFMLFLVLQLFLKFENAAPPEPLGPLFVQLQEAPAAVAVTEKSTPVPQPAPAPAPSQKAQTAAQPKAAAQPRVATQPNLSAASASASTWTTVPQPAAPSPQAGLPVQPSRVAAASEETRALPPEQQAYETPPAPVFTTRPPTPSQAIPAPVAAEVRPEAGTQQGSTLDLQRLDSALPAGGAAGTAQGGGTRAGVTGPATQGGAGASSAGNLEGPEIIFDKPSEAREVLEMPRPVIPDWVSRQGLRLQVLVRFALTPQGFLKDLQVIRSSGYSDVDSAVMEALRRWRFRAVNGGPDVTGRVPYLIVAR
jgi:TonB family protein